MQSHSTLVYSPGTLESLVVWEENDAPSLGNDLDFRNPLLAFGADALALVAWESDRPPDGTSIDFVGRFVGNRLFADDFESGSDVYSSAEQ